MKLSSFRYLSIFGLACFLLINPIEIKGQISGNNLAEFQFGNLPDVEPNNLSSLYNQLNLSYRYKNVFFKSRIESFYPSVGENKSYTSLNQYSIQYSENGIKIQAGSMYQTIGRGLLLRNYEQTSAIWEDRAYRVRYGFYKDMRGFAASYTNENFKIKLLRGRVLAVDLPPTLKESERRQDLVEGGELNYTLQNQTIGIAFLRHTNGSTSRNYMTTYFDGSYKSIAYYGEFAFSSKDSRAYYAGLNSYVGSLGFSLEYKNYKNFLIGAGISDPPTLVKEHSSRLLNRSTHVPILSNETGYQTEINYSFTNNSQLSFNHSVAKNQISSELSYLFKEYYLDYEVYPGNNWYALLFIDYSEDPFKAENQRYTSGLSIERQINSYTAGINIEFQKVKLDLGDEKTFTNMYSAVSLNKGSLFGISLILELSDNPLLIENDINWLVYPGITISYKPINSTSILLFAGKRRGGPACNSGVCYEILDFQGVELRLSTNF